MRFVLFVCTDPTGEPYDEATDDIPGWFSALQERGTHLAGDRLRPAQDATTVRVRGGKRVTSDGPFAETRESIAGFDLIDVADLDEAVEVAAAHPMARFGRIEVRPVWPL
jgi:hypothetical protein